MCGNRRNSKCSSYSSGSRTRSKSRSKSSDGTISDTTSDCDLYEEEKKDYMKVHFFYKCVKTMIKERIPYNNCKSLHIAFVIDTKTLKVISKGMNSGRMSFSGCQYEIHAEMEAIKNIKRNEDKTFSILVIRVTKSGLLGSSRPCTKCIKYIQFVSKKTNTKFDKVYYSNDDGTVSCERLSQMENNVISSRFRMNEHNRHVKSKSPNKKKGIKNKKRSSI